jgi:hypothetical protein
MANTPTHTKAMQLALILPTSLGLSLLISVVTSVNASADERRSSSYGYQLNHNAQSHRHTNSYRPYLYTGINHGYGLAPRYGTSISFGWSSLGLSYGSGYGSSPWDYRLGRSWGSDPWENDYHSGYRRSNYWHQARMMPRHWRERTYVYPTNSLILNGEKQGYDHSYNDDAEEYGFNNTDTDSYAPEPSSTESRRTENAVPIQKMATKVNYSSSLVSLPENARVIQLANGTVYEWQGVQYRFDWATQTYQKLASEHQAKE